MHHRNVIKQGWRAGGHLDKCELHSSCNLESDALKEGGHEQEKRRRRRRESGLTINSNISNYSEWTREDGATSRCDDDEFYSLLGARGDS